MEMLCFTGVVVAIMAALAGSPLLLADRARRRRHREFIKMRRNRLWSR